MGASGTLSDVLAVDEGIMKTLAAAGFIAPLDEYVAAFPYADGLSATFQSSINNFSYDGHMYMFPDSFGCQGIFVRTDWLTELGYKAGDLTEWTWDEYFDIIAKMTGNGRYGIAFRGGANGIRMYFEYLCSMLQVGSAFPEGTSKSVFEYPEAVECMEKFYGLYLNGYAPKESINWGFQEMVEGFVSGQCGTLNQTPEVVLTTSASMADVWTVLPSPRNPKAEKNYINWGSTAGFALANGEHQAEAWKFVEFMVKPENNLTYCKGFGYLPIYTEQLKDEYFQTGVMRGYADALANPKSALILTNDLTQWGLLPVGVWQAGDPEVHERRADRRTDLRQSGRMVHRSVESGALLTRP